jgi:predicted nuclease of predicted toxin-antitoxin system
VRVLLDENIPLRLYHRLREENQEVEHLALDRRGIPDAEIIQRLTDDDDLVLVTQDRDFENLRILRGGKVVISRLSQSMPIDERVRVWLTALETFLDSPPAGALFEIAGSGEVVPLPE